MAAERAAGASSHLVAARKMMPRISSPGNSRAEMTPKTAERSKQISPPVAALKKGPRDRDSRNSVLRDAGDENVVGSAADERMRRRAERSSNDFIYDKSDSKDQEDELVDEIEQDASASTEPSGFAPRPEQSPLKNTYAKKKGTIKIPVGSEDNDWGRQARREGKTSSAFAAAVAGMYA